MDMVKLLGIPFDANSSFLRGAAQAPPRIRLMEKDGSANGWSETGMEISPGHAYKDCGDMVIDSAMDMSSVFSQIKNTVAGLLQEGSPLCCLGGDHSVSYPIIDAFSEVYPDLHILHLDAHADLYHDFDSNPYSHASPFARIMEKGKVASLTQVGIRTLTAHQRAQARRFGVEVVEMNSFSLDFVQQLKGPLYLSLDLDVLDPAFAPGVAHHEPGGMDVRTVLHIIQQLPVPLVGADIVEYNPTRDVHQMTAMVAYKLMKEIMANMLG